MDPMPLDKPLYERQYLRFADTAQGMMTRWKMGLSAKGTALGQRISMTSHLFNVIPRSLFLFFAVIFWAPSLYVIWMASVDNSGWFRSVLCGKPVCGKFQEDGGKPECTHGCVFVNVWFCALVCARAVARTRALGLNWGLYLVGEWR